MSSRRPGKHNRGLSGEVPTSRRVGFSPATRHHGSTIGSRGRSGRMAGSMTLPRNSRPPPGISAPPGISSRHPAFSAAPPPQPSFNVPPSQPPSRGSTPSLGPPRLPSLKLPGLPSLKVPGGGGRGGPPPQPSFAVPPPSGREEAGEMSPPPHPAFSAAPPPPATDSMESVDGSDGPPPPHPAFSTPPPPEESPTSPAPSHPAFMAAPPAPSEEEADNVDSEKPSRALRHVNPLLSSAPASFGKSLQRSTSERVLGSPRGSSPASAVPKLGVPRIPSLKSADELLASSSWSGLSSTGNSPSGLSPSSSSGGWVKGKSTIRTPESRRTHLGTHSDGQTPQMDEDDDSGASSIADSSSAEFACYDAQTTRRSDSLGHRRSAPPPLPSAANRPPLTTEVEVGDPFSEPDCESNIIFMDGAKPGAPPLIKGGTLAKLVERTTHPKFGDSTLVNTFLLTYRSFCTAIELVGMMQQRFFQEPPVAIQGDIAKEQEWEDGPLKIIRLRVINFLKAWISDYAHEFVADDELREALLQYLKEVLPSAGKEAASKQLLKLYDRSVAQLEGKDREITFSSPPPAPILPKKAKKFIPAGMSIFEFSPEEVARQMCLQEHRLYRNINPWECLSHVTSKNKVRDAPNIVAMIDRFNAISLWVVTLILEATSEDDRLKRLKYWLSVTEFLKKYNNFNALMEIISGLGNTSVFRLKYLWSNVSQSTLDHFRECQTLMSREKNFAAFREHLSSINPPAIPYLGVYLTDLTFIGDGNKDFLDAEKRIIHFNKRTMLADVIRTVQQYQNQPYNLSPVPYLQDMMAQCTPLGQEDAYQVSLTILPRGAKQPIKVKSKKLRKERQHRLSMALDRSSVSKAMADADSASLHASAPDLHHASSASSSGGDSSTAPAAASSDGGSASSVDMSKMIMPNLFDEPDKPGENIIEREGVGGRALVIAGTVAKLVERVTPQKYADTHFCNEFLTTFPCFMSTRELLFMLKSRFHVPTPQGTDPAVHAKTVQLPIQLRVFNLLKMWIKRNWVDFGHSETLQTTLLAFFDEMSKVDMIKAAVTALKNSVLSLIEAGPASRVPSSDGVEMSPAIVPEKDTLESCLNANAVELARQLALRHRDMLLALPFRSMMSGELKAIEEVKIFVDEEQYIRRLVLHEIARESSLSTRTNVTMHWFSVVKESITLHSYYAAASIMSALRSDQLMKHNALWDSLPRSILEEICETELDTRNWINPRMPMEIDTEDPAIPPPSPFIAAIQRVIDKPSKTGPGDKMVDFNRCRKLNLHIQKLQALSPHHFHRVEVIQQYFAEQPSLPQETELIALLTSTKHDRFEVNRGRSHTGSSQDSLVQEPDSARLRNALLVAIKEDGDLVRQLRELLCADLVAQVDELKKRVEALESSKGTK